jgi:hypothetical protein
MSSFFVAAKTSALTNAQANLITAAGAGFTSAFERGIQLIGETDPNSTVGRMTNLNISDSEFAAYTTLCAAEIAASTMFGGSYSLADTLSWMSANNLKFQPTGLDFEPTVVDNCITWFDSAQLVYNSSGSLAINGESAQTWIDRTGFTVQFGQTNISFQPQYTVGTTNSYINFDGTDDYMYSLPVSALNGQDTPYTMFTVFQLGASIASGIKRPISFGSSTNNLPFVEVQINQMVNMRYGRRDDAGTQVVPGAGTPDLNWKIKTDVFLGQTVMQRVNATLTSLFSSANVATLTVEGVNIGAAFPTTSNWFQGRIYSVIVYNRALSAAEYSFVEGYLFTKYNLI